MSLLNFNNRHNKDISFPKNIRFSNILGMPLDGRGGQRFHLFYKENPLSSDHTMLCFYLRADEGLRECWIERDVTNYQECIQEIETTYGSADELPFAYVKRRVEEGVKSRQANNLPMLPEADDCLPILDSEAVNDVHWETPDFFQKQLSDFDLPKTKKALLHMLTEKIFKMRPSLIGWGWGLNTEAVDPFASVILKLPEDLFDVLLLERMAGDDFFEDEKILVKKSKEGLAYLMSELITEDILTEWKERTREQSYYMYNIGEKKLAEDVYLIHRTLDLVPNKVKITEHPFFIALVIISCMMCRKRQRVGWTV